MSAPAPENRYEQAAKLIEQAPPGQVREVIQDLQVITNNDPEFMPLALSHLAAYNLAQFVVVGNPGHAGNGKTIISKASLVPTHPSNANSDPHSHESQTTHVDPESKQAFGLEHAQLGTLEVKDHIIPEEHERFRSALSRSLTSYLANHFSSSDSACGVFCDTPVKLKEEKVVQPEVEAAAVEGGSGKEMDVGEKEVKEEEPQKEVKEEKPIESEPESQATPEEQAEEREETVKPETSTDVDADTNEPTSTSSIAPSDTDSKPLISTITETLSDLSTAITGPTESTTESVEAGEEPVLPVKPAEDAPEEKKEISGVNEVAGAEGKEDMSGMEVDGAKEKVDGEAEKGKDQEVAEPEVTHDPTYTLQIVGNKYNTSNFWTGRWRSSYIVNPKSSLIQGSIHVDVHYFEQGNVQLAASYSPSFAYPTGTDEEKVASEIVGQIAKLEQGYQSRLNETYSELGEKAFRSLRRALPITRQKVDWDKIGGYKLGLQNTK